MADNCIRQSVSPILIFEALTSQLSLLELSFICTCFIVKYICHGKGRGSFKRDKNEIISGVMTAAKSHECSRKHHKMKNIYLIKKIKLKLIPLIDTVLVSCSVQGNIGLLHYIMSLNTFIVIV